MNLQKLSRFKKNRLFFLIVIVLLVTLGAALTAHLIQLNKTIQTRLENGWFLPPIELYAKGSALKPGDLLDINSWQTLANQWGWRSREPHQSLLAGDFQWLPDTDCPRSHAQTPSESPFETSGTQLPSSCLKFQTPTNSPIWILVQNSKILDITDDRQNKLESFSLPRTRFAQIYQNQFILRDLVSMGDIPLMCAQAVVAIEDEDFLIHRGISITGILRAIIRNLKQARFAEGASTITQQLVKNYFLTSEKTLQRKLTEQLMSILIELKFDKDTILSNYLNAIYMGQNGSFQIRGFAAASQYFFSKPLAKLELHECALLAAVINNPGRYNPLKNPEKAKARRDLVLSKMVEQKMILTEEADHSTSLALDTHPTLTQKEPAPFFVQAVLEEIEHMKISSDHGLKIETTLDLDLQDRAQKGLEGALKELEDRHPHLNPKDKKSPSLLQGALITLNTKTGGITSLLGGRNYKLSQFDRIRLSRRQPGSLFKPFVYLAALKTEKYQPDSLLQDVPWTYRYEGQTWTPKNYDKNFRGPVTLTEALSLSLNIPTARLATDIGIDLVIETAHELGIKAELQNLPSISLGALEITPLELAQAYLTIANQGKYNSIHMIERIKDASGQMIFENHDTPRQVFEPELIQKVTSMLQETFRSGTAKSFFTQVEKYEQFPSGKTGTTSDSKDNWFIGYDSEALTLTWVGFDDNSPTRLTGASAALPIWGAVHPHKLQSLQP